MGKKIQIKVAKRSQREQVKDLLKDGKRITQQSVLYLGITRLAARISELKSSGFLVVSRSVENPATGHTEAEYHHPA